jgi:hypothetical protein
VSGHLPPGPLRKEEVMLREYERNRAGFRGVGVEELKSWGKAHECLKPAAHQGVRRRSRLR